MSDIASEFTQLIQGYQSSDPRLYAALMMMVQKVQALDIQLNPLVIQSQFQAAIDASVVAPDDFSFSFTSRTVRFTWSEVSGASQYEIRKGIDWDTASFVVRTVSLQADIDPLTIGTHTYLIKSITASGRYSTTPTELVVTVPTIPAVILSFELISNNVLLFWSEPLSSFEIDFYEVFKDGVSLGILTGTFFTRFETAAGTYEYKVIATDVAGNNSVEALLDIDVPSPPDFELQDTFVSSFSGTKTDVTVDDGFLLCSINTTETYQDHFDNNSWASPQEQVDAGYPLVMEPADTSGQYEEKIDFGTILSSIIATVTYSRIEVSGSVTVLIEVAVSDDDITYTSFTAGAVQFFASFRYFKLRLTFTGSDDKSLLLISNLTVRLDVKREQDGGIVNAVSTDVGGTTVNFNKAFHDIDSINATPMGTAERKAVVDFTDAPDPTSFKVLLFDAAGARVTGDVRWIARGIV